MPLNCATLLGHNEDPTRDIYMLSARPPGPRRWVKEVEVYEQKSSAGENVTSTQPESNSLITTDHRDTSPDEPYAEARML